MDIAHVAKLANLPLTLEEEKIYEPQLNSVLGYVDQLQKIDTTAVTETVTGETNVLREDKVEDCPPMITGFIKTKAIFKND